MHPAWFWSIWTDQDSIAVLVIGFAVFISFVGLSMVVHAFRAPCAECERRRSPPRIEVDSSKPVAR